MAILSGLDLDQKQEHHTLVSALPTDVVLKVQDPVVSFPKDKMFHNRKGVLIQRYKKPDRVYFNELQNLTLGDDSTYSLWGPDNDNQLPVHHASTRPSVVTDSAHKATYRCSDSLGHALPHSGSQDYPGYS